MEIYVIYLWIIDYEKREKKNGEKIDRKLNKTKKYVALTSVFFQ